MRLDQVTAEIRPRGDLESVDLGLALVRRDFWRCLAGWWMALGLPGVVVGWCLWDWPLLFLLWFWWCKPAGSRMVLLQLSRRLFGEQPTWHALWRELPGAWLRRFFHRFVWVRFSPWMPVTLAVEELEGLRGADYQRRIGQLVRRGNGVVIWIYCMADLAALWFGLAIFGVVAMMIPDGQDAPWARALEEWNPATPLHLPVLLLRTACGCVMLAMSLTDIMLTGAGFGLYVNSRTWIDGWDVELAFRRMGERLTKGLGMLMLLGCLCLPTGVRAEAAAEAERTPRAVIEDVKAERDFRVHKVKLRVTQHQPIPISSFWGTLGGMLGWLLAAAAVALALGFLVWLVWKYRHVLVSRGGADQGARALAARVVMGLAVTPESLPQDIPGTAWSLWQQGRRQEALGLLYRGTIARTIELARVEIHEADTEGDCLRRIEAAGGLAHPGYFRGLTGVWIRLAYAGESPADAEVEGLCREWPFLERRSA
ncbi:MAG: hypothetical protein NTW21_21915 [Verrucomicrobia bacterium]|nr:hypothetical protein [Verrucomicrobiota bacterium]